MEKHRVSTQQLLLLKKLITFSALWTDRAELTFNERCSKEVHLFEWAANVPQQTENRRY